MKTKILLAALVTAVLESAGSALGGDIWLSSTNNLAYVNTQTNSGAGTLQNPYSGDFDYIMGNYVPINSTVHLGSGIFWTKGNAFDIPYGTTVEGEGEAFTTVRRATNFAGYGQANINVLLSDRSNVTVRNLTVDCNAFDFYYQNWRHSIGGVDLSGSGETIEHVTDINGLGFMYAPEGFQLSIGEYGQTGNKVIGCTVSNFLGTYGDGIAPSGDCVVEGNYIYLPVQPAGIPFRPLFGINVVGAMKSALIVGNHVFGGGDAFHNDTGGDTNVTIANNVFENVCQGVNLTGDRLPYNSIIISHNLMTQETNRTVYQQQLYMIDIETQLQGETNQNITVDGNIIHYYQDVPFASDGEQGAIFINGSGGQLNENISIINNQIDARMPNEFVGNILNLYASGNLPLNGTNFATANGHPGLTNVAGSQTISQQ